MRGVEFPPILVLYGCPKVPLLLTFYTQQVGDDFCLDNKQKFKTVNNDQLFLLPPSVVDSITANHLARFVNEVVETIYTSAIEAKYNYLGQKSYPPHLLLELSSPQSLHWPSAPAKDPRF